MQRKITSLTNVTSGECDDQLLTLGALCSWLGHNIFVESLQGALKAGELHHGVGNLSRPQWHKALVEPVKK
jgi:hypothetical protein